MASVMKNVFKVNQVLNHENAARELVIRWNGPDVAHSDGLIEQVLRRRPELNNFVRVNIAQSCDAIIDSFFWMVDLRCFFVMDFTILHSFITSTAMFQGDQTLHHN